MSALPRDINSAMPFKNFYAKYREKGWYGTLPLPAKRKESPPENFTGYKPESKLHAEQSDIDLWLTQKRWAKGNICLRLGEPILLDGQQYEVMALDVDHYDAKHGADELLELESKYGTLPPTWISTSRTDGVSGIRFYLVPIGLAFRGQPSPSIETIQRRHRYAVVYPSWHPNGHQYYWYEPGCAPDGVHVSDELPSVYELPKLPDAWVDFMTNGRVPDRAGEMDNDIDEVELAKWLSDNLVDGNGEMCRMVEKRCAARIQECEDTTSHHDLMRSTHWEFVKLGVEGHTGWFRALGLFNPEWRASVVKEGKRTLYKAQTETKGSFLGAARKVKGEFDAGNLDLMQGCRCGGSPPGGPPGIGFGFGVPPSPGVGDPDSYSRNDNGNARYFLALYGANVRYVGNHPEGGGKWIVFNENTKRWVVDSKDVITRTLFREVEKRQIAFGRDLQELARLRNRPGASIPASLQGISTRFPVQNFQPDDLDKLAGIWIKWGTDSGNSARVSNSLKQATYYDEVALDYEQLDSDPYLLPVANGLLRFHTKEERDAGKGSYEWIEDVGLCKEYLVTQNTNVPYIPFAEQENHSDPTIRQSYSKFTDYVDKFLLSHMSNEVFDYTRRVLGISVLGINVKKAIFLYGRNDTGKSTLQNMMNEAMGDLAIGREPRIFLDSPFKGSLAEALPRRMCMVGELGAKEMDAGLFKAITGNDLVDCQLKNINKPVSMRARCTIISSCNSEPFIPEVDEATKSRFIVIPFRHQVTGKERDDKAQDDLMQHCKVSTLAWLVESCCDALEHGITDAPAELQMEASTFTANMSDMSDFVNECLVRYDNTPEAKKYARNDETDPRDPKPRWPNEMCTGHRKMYGAYAEYSRQNNMEKISSHMFTRKMKQAGFVQDGSRNGDNEIRWIGIALKGSDRVASS